MGAFFYCNKQVETDKICKVFETRGHKDITSEIRKGETLVYAGKILTHTVTFLSANQLSDGCSPDDYIIGVGTFFYDGTFGDDALKKVFKNLDVVLKENPVYGHWAFVVHKDGITYIFNDMSGTLRLYCYEENGKVIVSSSPLSTVAAIDEPKFSRVLLSAYLAGHYGNEIVPVQGVYNINPNQYLKIVDGKYSWIDRKVPEVKRVETLEEALVYVKDLFREQMAQLRAIGDEKISIELTAGLDSRLIASNLKTTGFHYDFLNYPLFGPDKEIAELIANGLGKKLLIQTNESCSDLERHYGEWDYGFDFFRQYANSRWKIENRFQFSGGRGECLDLPDIYSDENVKMKDDPRLKVLMSPLATTSMMDDQRKEEYLEYMYNFYSERGYPIDEPLTEQQQLEFGQTLCGQFSGDYMYNDGVQAHIYFYQIYNEWHFNHFISNIAFDAKSGRKLSLALIKTIDPELGSFPFVSRRRTKRKSVNETKELPIQYFSYNGIKKILPKGIVNYLYSRMGRKFPQSRLGDINLDYYKDVIKVNEIKRHPNLYFSILNRLYSIEVIRKIMKIQ